MATAYSALRLINNSEEGSSQALLGGQTEESSTINKIQAGPRGDSPWLLASLCIAIFCVCLNLFVPVHTPTQYRPDIYIGLNKLDKSEIRLSLPSYLAIFPHIFCPVSAEEPNRVFRTDGNARITFEGLVSPGEPHVIINKHVSMIMQHRVQDYGLQKCAFAATIPNPALLPAQNRSLTIAPFDFELDIWLLDTVDAVLDVRKLSWNTKPIRKGKIGSMVVRRDAETFSPEFFCGVSGSVRTYELACKYGDSLCEVAFIQMQPETKPRMAFTIHQRP